MAKEEEGKRAADRETSPDQGEIKGSLEDDK